ncbi:DUF968 domain-containing protein [Allosphingosinicella flava]|uniref:DUF968 domain-containing protein n=1 Tax=Allosphingosinicella flava TaxID=2771430 RepID=A0A7T2GKJ6_9SPHN|nr:putative HNHc nuclease [Sphingosinicella flava]QPQ55559.1 DUF968 domain-containing protein [Sphingosinicella flava]
MALPARIRHKSGRENAGKRCPGHCTFVRNHECCVPGCGGRPIEVAHVRTGTGGGIGVKPSDRWVISLCRDHHSEQHRIGEASFEKRHGIDMRALAEEFARKSPHAPKLREMP